MSFSSIGFYLSSASSSLIFIFFIGKFVNESKFVNIDMNTLYLQRMLRIWFGEVSM